MGRTVWRKLVFVVNITLWFSGGAAASDLSEVLFAKGMMKFDQGLYGDAVKAFQGALQEDPANLDTRTYLYLARARAAGAASVVRFMEGEARRKPQQWQAHLDLACALFMEGSTDRAFGAIEEAAKLAPMNAEVLFSRGLIRMRLGQLKEAVADLQQARQLDPKMAQGTMFYEALALKNLGQRDAAKTVFNRVVQANPLTGYAVEAAEQTRTEPWTRFSARIGTGVEYDTNVTLEGRSNSLGMPLKAWERFQVRFPLSALLDYRFADWGEWSFGARYGFYAGIHNKNNDMDVVNNMAELYGIWRKGQWGLRPFYYYQSVLLGSEQFSDTHSIGASLTYRAPYDLVPEIYVRGQSREYHFSTMEKSDPDSFNMRMEYNQYYLLQGGNGYLRAGVGWEGNQAEGSNLDYRAVLLLGGIQYQLPWKLQFNFDFEYQRRSYERVHSLFGVERDDQQYTLAWQLSRPLGRGLEVKGRLAHIRNDSSIGDFDYHRQIYSLLFTWNY